MRRRPGLEAHPLCHLKSAAEVLSFRRGLRCLLSSGCNQLLSLLHLSLGFPSDDGSPLQLDLFLFTELCGPAVRRELGFRRWPCVGTSGAWAWGRVSPLEGSGGSGDIGRCGATCCRGRGRDARGHQKTALLDDRSHLDVFKKGHDRSRGGRRWNRGSKCELRPKTGVFSRAGSESCGGCVWFCAARGSGKKEPSWRELKMPSLSEFFVSGPQRCLSWK